MYVTMSKGRDGHDEFDEKVAFQMVKHPTWGFRRIARIMQAPEQKVRYRLNKLRGLKREGTKFGGAPR